MARATVRLAAALLVLVWIDACVAIDREKVLNFYKAMKKRYPVIGMYSMALRIPAVNQNQDANTLLSEFDDPTKVAEVVNKGDVYSGDRVLAAKYVAHENRNEHAEARVASVLSTWNDKKKSDWILFYVYASPCSTKCADEKHPENILTNIQNLKQWNSYAFVYTKVYQQDLNPRASIEKLGDAFGTQNIFRCDNGECVNCLNKKKNIKEFCISNEI